ncbi:GntR family transcriptional regulator [Nocardioides baekrokdamisoli]|uniref:GntR family transcriptional regulator n=2 Tax=Nocardioides baekrokdamisoli TaxID=1804624 RepID=A0A3G9IMY8_9ACTN|nr:GntR family transcriptional regulator [Nocardioides baekrokdamisoli]
MTASEIRALFAVASRPEVVSLAGGMPNISGLPLDVVGEALRELVLTNGPVAMQYGSGQGLPELREKITDIMRLEGIEAHADDVVVTVGSQQAVDLVTRVFCDPGDVIICEAPSYVGALGVFKSYQCEIVHAEMDADGLIPEAVRQAIAATKAAGKKIKFLYTIPNFHNPAGVTLSAQRRLEILEICRTEGVLVLEDNPYGLLGFDRDPMRAMRAEESEGIIYLGSFSKTFAPGFRVGWALAPASVREKLVLAQESATLCPPQFSQMAISTYLDKADWQGQIKQFREMYRERRDAMVGALTDLMPAGCSWNVPDGGFYVWMTMPLGVNTKTMLPNAVKERVAYVPGTAFFTDGFGSGAMRLSYCYPPPDKIREGVRRLAGVVERQLDMLQTFGTAEGIPGLPIRGDEAPPTDLR